MQFPFVTHPDGSYLLDVFHSGEVNVGPSLVLAEDEVRPVVFQIRAFAESDSVVLGIEFEASGFKRHRASWVFVVVFAVLRRIRSYVSVVSFTVLAVERLSEFLKDSLT